MVKNVGKTDRIIRVLVAVLLLVLLLTKTIHGGLALLSVIVTIAFLFTGFSSFCPCYMQLKINTNKKEKE